MRIKLILFLALALLGFKATADDHASPFTVFIGISTDNPAAVVGAWDTFMASDCGKSHPGQVSIMNEFFNGEYPATHTVIVSYPNQQAWAQGVANNRCLEWSQLMRNVSTVTEPVFQTLGMGVLAGGDLSKDGAYTIVQMDVLDEAKYAAAFVPIESQIKSKGNLKLLILRGIFGGLTMVLLFCSYSMIPLSQATAVTFSTPLFVYLGGIIFFKEKTSQFNNLMIILDILSSE